MSTAVEVLTTEMAITPQEANYLILAAAYGYSAFRLGKATGWDEATCKTRLERAAQVARDHRKEIV